MSIEDQETPLDAEQIHRFRLPEETPETVQRTYDTFCRKYFDEFHANAHPIKPTPEQEQLVKEAIQEIPRILATYGITNINFSQRPLPKIFFLDRKDFYKYALDKELNTRELVTTRAVYKPVVHAFLMYLPKSRKRNERNEEILHNNVHELLHVLSFRRLQIYKNKPGSEHKHTLRYQRIGISIAPWAENETRTPDQRLENLNEAITEDLAIEETNAISPRIPNNSTVRSVIKSTLFLHGLALKPPELSSLKKKQKNFTTMEYSPIPKSPIASHNPDTPSILTKIYLDKATQKSANGSTKLSTLFARAQVKPNRR